jgi:hypothetical protein
MEARQKEQLLATLEQRFAKNKRRHPDLEWTAVAARLEADPKKLRTLFEMEKTGGEPDVTGYDQKSKEYIYCDCSVQSPEGRRSVCYDSEALEARKKNKPENSATAMAASIGIELLDEQQYRELQHLGEFDTKTSSWLKTPAEIRRLGGAIFGDFRYGQVFIYHNGADSYYAARGFRGTLRV